MMRGPLSVCLFFAFPRPKSHFKKDGSLTSSAPLYHTKKPDADNIAKAVLDALTDAGLWEDDSQIVSLITVKGYAPDNQTAGCVVTIDNAKEEAPQ